MSHDVEWKSADSTTTHPSEGCLKDENDHQAIRSRLEQRGEICQGSSQADRVKLSETHASASSLKSSRDIIPNRSSMVDVFVQCSQVQ